MLNYSWRRNHMKKEIETNTTDIVKGAIKDSEMTMADYAKELGVSPQALNGRLNRNNNLSIGMIVEMLGKLGYSVYVVPDGKVVKDGKKIDLVLEKKENKEE